MEDSSEKIYGWFSNKQLENIREKFSRPYIYYKDIYGNIVQVTEVKNNRHTKCLFDDALSLGELVKFHSSDKFPLPDIYVRESLLKVHCKNLFLSEDLNLVDIAKITNGTTGADLSIICKEAAFLSSKRDASTVQFSDFDKAINNFHSGNISQVDSIDENVSSSRLVNADTPLDKVHGVQMYRAGGSGLRLPMPFEIPYMSDEQLNENDSV